MRASTVYVNREELVYIASLGLERIKVVLMAI
jgi:hypothetical protein